MSTTMRLSLCGVLLGLLADSATAQTRPAPALSPAEVFAIAKDSVVTVKTSKGQGSGVVVVSTGVIVTNLHVIAGAKSAAVTLPNGDSYDVASVVAVDQRRDLALLRIAGFELPVALLGNSDSSVVGDRVLAIGSPSGLELSLSDGIVSAVRDSGDGYKVLQTTAAISPGSSGGGLFNMRGELVGITSFKIRDAENVNFAIPVNYVRGLMSAPTSAMSLSDVANRFAASAVEQDRSAAKAESPIARVPRLDIEYQHSQGARVLVKQREGSATLTLYRADYSIYGNASVTWSEPAKGFLGTAEVNYVCGEFDTRITTIKSGFEIFLERDGTVRMRYQVPSRINCSKNIVGNLTWGEDKWYPR